MGRLLVVISLARPNGRVGPLPRALIGGAQPYMVGGPPVTLRYKERWRPAHTRFTVSHHTLRQTQSDLVRSVASDGKLH